MTAIERAFNGPIKFQESPGSAWQRKYLQQRDHYECQTNEKSSSNLLDSSKYQLMDSSVQPSQTNPLFVTELERLRHITIDKVSTKLHENVRIIYVSNSNGLIKKISLLPRLKKSCLIEVMEPESNRNIEIKTIEFVKATDSLYIGTENSLIKIPSQRCHRHVSKESCLNSMDPMCGWNDLLLKCTAAPNGDPLARYWMQNATECPILSNSVDGAFSAWSTWHKCAKSGEEPITGDELSANIDTCLCRTRQCNNPSPKNGGKECTGHTIMVINCTVNGAWSDWSQWSSWLVKF